ncbi:DUF3667 domain-containing protein [Gaetbulibacter sp. NE]|uniref:DUF3667 domain-containing protein n=1 Tax=Gaetbulibacter sp. NE TaxID=2982307 RepID=UPI0021D131D5|nr:DUF3667 domain-containing protein [Gaetbulibacter sp. NE]
MNCKNCNTNLAVEQNYCFECGAKIIRNRLTLSNIFSEVKEHLFQYDNKLFQTFILLFKKPEAVINSYIDGTRKKYINVIQYFAISLTLIGIQVFLLNTFFEDVLFKDISFLNKFDNGVTNSSDFLKDQATIQQKVSNYQNIIYIITVPISAFATWAAHYLTNYRQFNFTEHIVINLYYSSQAIIVTALLNIIFLCVGANYYVISSLISFLTIVYYIYIFKRVIGAGFWQTLANMLVMFFIYAIISLILLSPIIINGIKEGIDAANKVKGA